MTHLALTLPPSECETTTSWISRLAARNGATYVQDFVEDLGFSWQRVIGGDQAVITEICQVAAIDPSKVLRYAKRTERNRELQTFIGSIPVGTKFCQNNLMSICPRCITEWQTEGGQLVAGAPVWWQAVAVRSCHRHGISLIELPKPEDVRCNYDVAGRVRDNIGTIRCANEAAIPAPVRDFELYMISRLSASKRMAGGWLDSMDVVIVANVCQALGLTLINRARQPATSRSSNDLALAADAGFKALRHGPEEMSKHMRSAQDGPAGGGMGFMQDFNPFYRYLSRMEVNNGSKLLQNAVRAYIIENYPTGAEETVFTKQAGRRFLHSPLSASLQANVARARLVKALESIRDSDAFPDLPRPTTNLWIPSKEWDPWLIKYSETMIFKKAARFIGASAATLQKSVDAGWVKPFVDFPKQVPRFHLSELDRFRDRMLAGAREIDVLDETMVRIDFAPTLFAVQLVSLLRLILDGRLKKIYCEAGRYGLRSIVLNKNEILDLIEQPEAAGLPVDDARRHLHVSSRTMALIIRKRMIDVVHARHHRTRQRTRYITTDAIDKFFRKYETLGRLAHFEHVQAKSVQARLNRLQINPLPFPSPHSKIYRRRDLAPYLG